MTPDEFLRRLRGLVPGRPSDADRELRLQLAEWSEQRQFDLLQELATRIMADAGRSIHEWEASAQMRQIEAALAGSSDGAALEALLRIVAAPGDRSGFTA